MRAMETDFSLVGRSGRAGRVAPSLMPGHLSGAPMGNSDNPVCNSRT